MVPSRRDVASYDLAPEMSAVELTDRFVEEIGQGYAFAVLNFANPDMVGHTGVIPAVVAAVETADACLGRVVEAVEAAGGVCLITADHGNAEKMLEDDGVSPHTAHTTNPVPLICTESGLMLRGDGELSDLVPTALALLDLAKPLHMTGSNLANVAPITRLSWRTLSLPQPDFGVLRKAQRGDERAFSIIVRAYQVPVFNYVLRLVGDRSLAEDLTQEVFLRVFQGLPRFSLRSKFTTWLFQVTKNRVLDELRAMERRPRAVVDIEDVPPLEVLDAPFERLEAIDAVWRAIEGLNVDLKMALLLRDIVGLSYTEIADSLEVTLATVKWRIYKAREDVQLALAREGIHLYGESEADAVIAPDRRRSLRLTRRGLAPQQGRERGRTYLSARAGHRPASSRWASRSGRPASRISACVRAMSYSTRRKLAVRSSRSSRRYAARGSPSRGWPTEPGFSRVRASERSSSVPPGESSPVKASPASLTCSAT